ncbi:exonuclease SbcCD subunit D [Peribacillus sp. SCS-155]|uniref:metallophosphoesterase family protein n=1 Tax=Peribacillus sedimenti TaxID=3115297 RepID=UPI00390665D4
MGKLVFLHAADIHLDSPFSGLKKMPAYMAETVRESAYKAFTSLIDTAISTKVDFLLIAGDLFDGENRSLRTQVRIRKEMERLNEVQIPVYLIHGNHDHLGGSWINIQMPENVHIFDSRPEVKQFLKADGTTVNIYGYSYPKRHVTERIISLYKKSEGADYHIGMLHGNLEGFTEHSPYAPFALKELLEKDFDYWALGHIHKRNVISQDPPVIYPGNTQGRNKKETGEKGCYLVTLDGSTAEYVFKRTGHVIWEEAVIKVQDAGQFDDVLRHCRKEIEDRMTAGKGFLCSIRLDISDHSNVQAFNDEFTQGLLEILQEEAMDGESIVWPYSISVDARYLPYDPDSPFVEELLELAEGFSDFDPALEGLYKHAGARKYLDALDDTDKQELLRDSKRLLRQLL